MKTYYCNTCERRLPKTEFYKDAYTRCKECTAEANADMDDGLKHERTPGKYSLWNANYGYVDIDIASRDTIDLRKYLRDVEYLELEKLVSWHFAYQLVSWTDFGPSILRSDIYDFIATYIGDIIHFYTTENEYKKVKGMDINIYSALTQWQLVGDIKFEHSDANKPLMRPFLYYLDKKLYWEYH